MAEALPRTLGLPGVLNVKVEEWLEDLREHPTDRKRIKEKTFSVLLISIVKWIGKTALTI